jgi:phosphotransferase system enzyme I (PtsI)
MASFTLHGIPVSRGIAIGRAHLLAPAALDVKHYLIQEEHVEAEVARLQQALAAVHVELQTLWNELPKDAPTELGAFIDVHVLILSDPMISEAPLDIIRSRHYNAEWALVTQIEELSAQFDEIEDPYLRERKADIQQVAERVLKKLLGSEPLQTARAGDGDEFAAKMIVVAHDISPADMLKFRDGSFIGFVTDVGGQNSHTAIVARSLDIPATVGVSQASRLIEQDDWVIIDGDAGVVIVSPSALVLEQYRERQQAAARARKKLSKLKKTPGDYERRHGHHLAGQHRTAGRLRPGAGSGANGVGLFRSEFLFMGRGAEQYAGRGRAVRAVPQGGGGDEGPPRHYPHPGYRRRQAARSDRTHGAQSGPGPARDPLLPGRAAAVPDPAARDPARLGLRQGAHPDPDAGACLRDRPVAGHDRAGQGPAARSRTSSSMPMIEVGAMIEIPAAALALPMFVKRMNFLSIGTNDLIQYTLAIDRVDYEVAHLYNPLHPAVLHLIAMTIAAGRKAGIDVAVCGEMAGDVKLTRLLLGMGLREFSMHPAQLLAVKQEILNSDLAVLCRAPARSCARWNRTRSPTPSAAASDVKKEPMGSIGTLVSPSGDAFRRTAAEPLLQSGAAIAATR